jgi:hypothetical protein
MKHAVVAVAGAVLLLSLVSLFLRGSISGSGAHHTFSCALSENLPVDEQVAVLRAEKKALRREVGRLSCALNGVGPNGGYCLSETVAAIGGNDILSTVLSEALFELFRASSVIDLGAGIGHYESHWVSLAERGLNGPGPTSMRAYDGAENIETVTSGRVQWADLTERVDFGAADWVLSLEVAEHIPADKEHIFLDNLQRHARKGMVISWAVPGQGGHHHVNTQDESYVVPTVEKLGFVFDRAATSRIRTLMLQTVVAQWFRETLFVFRRK